MKNLLTIEQIRQKGFEVLNHALGTVNALHFLRSFYLGEGDYTAQRKKNLKETSVSEIVNNIKKARKK